MGATGIKWTIGPNGEPGFTFNPWIGCTKILGSDPRMSACLHCYAEPASKKLGASWGPHAPRRPVSDGTWAAPRAWDRRAQREGKRFRVFCASMADVLDNHRLIEPMWRERLYMLVDETPNLDWLFLTKRPENAANFLPAHWLAGDGANWPANLWFGVTVENQRTASQRIPLLLTMPAPVRFLSMEPLLERVDLRCISTMRWRGAEVLNALTGRLEGMFGDYCPTRLRPLEWVITGGESGRLVDIRETPDEWMIDLGEQCARADVPFFAKQLSQLLHRRDYKKFDLFPPALRVRQHPAPRRVAA